MINFEFKMPECVEHKGISYRIKSDFRVWINFEKILYSDLQWFEKMVEIFKLCYKDNLPPDAGIALKLLIDFYCGGKTNEENRNDIKDTIIRIYDFEQDAELFYAAFMQQYNIDLTKENLHWWKFIALFRSLAQDTKLFSVMRWRAMDLSEISDKKQKEHYKKLKRMYRLPNRYLKDADGELAEVISQIML